MRALRLSVATAMLVVVAGCATPEKTSMGKENEVAAPDKGPQEALADARATSKDLLTALFPGRKVTVVGTSAAVPCGGVGGSEFSKIHHDFEAGLKPATDDARLDDLEAFFAEAGSQMEALGLEVMGPQTTPAGKGLVFGGDGFGGKLLVHVEGAVMVRGQTACLDNPDGLR